MTRRLEIEDLYELAIPAQPAMSPDGGRIVCVLRTADRENNRNVAQLAFLTATVGAWGEADAKDFLEPLDQLVAEGVADADRLAVVGYSYGGYKTCPNRSSSMTWRR